MGGGLMTSDIGVHFIFESWDFSVGTSCDLCTVILHCDVCHILARISTPAGATSNLEVVIHKHLLAVTNFAILTKGLASNQSEPKSGSPIQKSSSSTLTRGHITFTISQKQCIKEKIFPPECGLFRCMCLWRRQFHTKKQGYKDICGQFFLHETQRKQVFFNKLQYLPSIYVIQAQILHGWGVQGL